MGRALQVAEEGAQTTCKGSLPVSSRTHVPPEAHLQEGAKGDIHHHLRSPAENNEGHVSGGGTGGTTKRGRVGDQGKIQQPQTRQQTNRGVGPLPKRRKAKEQ